MMIRVLFRSLSDGAVFPMYFDGDNIEEQIADAAEFMKAEEVSRQEGNPFILLTEQLAALNRSN